MRKVIQGQGQIMGHPSLNYIIVPKILISYTSQMKYCIKYLYYNWEGFKSNCDLRIKIRAHL